MSLIEQIKSGALWDFPGGIHPPENKQQSNAAALAYADIADELVLPLKLHIYAGIIVIPTKSPFNV